MTGSTLFRSFRKGWAGSLGVGHYLFAVVFLVRLIVLIRFASSALFLPTGSDMQFYDQWAKQILGGRWTDHQAFYGLPLYPFLVALLYRIFGYGPFLPGLLQACADAATAVLIYKIAIRAVADRSANPGAGANFAALTAAAGWCLFLPAQAYAVILMPTAGITFVFWLLVWQIVKSKDWASGPRWFGYGALIGFSAMGVATALFLIPLFFAAIFLRQSQASLAVRSIAVLLLCAGVFSGSSPCWIHNYFVAKEPVFLSAHGGINLWLGNNPEATGYPRFPGLHAGQGEMLRDSIDQAEAAAGRSLKRWEVSRYWSAKARSYIAASPASWLKLLGRKLANFWNAFEYDDLGVIANLRQQGVLFPGLRFALVAVFGVSGAIFGWRPSTVSRWIVAAIGLYLLAILPVFVTERYRLVVVPGLLVLAVLGLTELWRRCFKRNYGAAALQLAGVGACAWFVTIPRHDPSLWALEAYNSGRFALETNNLPSAEQQLYRAYTLVPDNAETNFALGNLRFAQGDSPAAKTFYETVLKIDPKHKAALNNLGILALEENQPAAAADYFQRALALEPRNAKAHYLLARSFFALGELTDAAISLRRAVELSGERPEFGALRDQLDAARK